MLFSYRKYALEQKGTVSEPLTLVIGLLGDMNSVGQLRVCFSLPEGVTIRESGEAMAATTNPKFFYNSSAVTKSLRNLQGTQDRLRWGTNLLARLQSHCCINPYMLQNFQRSRQPLPPLIHPYTAVHLPHHLPLSVPISHILPKRTYLPLSDSVPATTPSLHILLLHL